MIRCVVLCQDDPAGAYDSEMPHAGHQWELFLFLDAWLTRGGAEARGHLGLLCRTRRRRSRLPLAYRRVSSEGPATLCYVADAGHHSVTVAQQPPGTRFPVHQQLRMSTG